MPANEVRFIILTNYTNTEIVDTIVVTGVGFIRDNGMSSGGRVGVISAIRVGFIPVEEIGMSFIDDYNIGSGIELDASGDLKDVEVCLGALQL